MDRDVGGAGDATEGKTTMAMTATTPTLPLVFERFLEAEGVSRSTYDAYYGPSQSGSDSRVAVDGDDGHSNSGQGRPTVPQRYFTYA